MKREKKLAEKEMAMLMGIEVPKKKKKKQTDEEAAAAVSIDRARTLPASPGLCLPSCFTCSAVSPAQLLHLLSCFTRSHATPAPPPRSHSHTAGRRGARGVQIRGRNGQGGVCSIP